MRYSKAPSTRLTRQVRQVRLARSVWRRRVSVIVAVVCCLLLTPTSLWGQLEEPQTEPQAASFEERREAVMAFVHENHPKMEQLLLTLEKLRPVKFESAVTRVERALENMSGLEEKNPMKYSLKVERWKIKSDIEILTARIGLGQKNDEADVDKLREELVVKINLLVDLRKKIIQVEKASVEQRLGKVNRSIARVEEERDAFVEKQLQSVEIALQKLKSNKLKFNKLRSNKLSPINGAK